MNPFFAKCGIAHRPSYPHHHKQNGFVERKHCHIVDTSLTLLATASMSHKYWDEAFTTTCFLINRIPSPVLKNKSPFQVLFNQTPDFNFLKVFGCACWPHLCPYNTRKFDFRSKLYVFLGYSLHHRGYCCLHIPSGRVYISKNVIFDETRFPFGLSSQTPTSTLISSLPQSLQVPTASPSTSSHVSSPAPTFGLPCPSTEPVPSPVAPSATMVPTTPSHNMQTR